MAEQLVHGGYLYKVTATGHAFYLPNSDAPWIYYEESDRSYMEKPWKRTWIYKYTNKQWFVRLPGASLFTPLALEVKAFDQSNYGGTDGN